MINKMDLFKNYDFYERTTPGFAQAFQVFMPQWLDSLVKYYEVAKKNGAELFGLFREMDYNNDPNRRIIDNGITYHISKFSESFTYMSLSTDHDGYLPGDWENDFCLFYQAQNTNDDIQDFIAYNRYTNRLSNVKPPYDVLANDVRDYFRHITGDPEVFFSFSRWSYICLSKRAASYVYYNYRLQ